MLSDFGPTVLRAWNQQSTQQAQLGGSKRVAILFLLGCPPEAVELLLKHASEFGTASAFPEEAFAKKALQIGYTPRGMSKDWVRRLTVTEKSFLLRPSRIQSPWQGFCCASTQHTLSLGRTRGH